MFGNNEFKKQVASALKQLESQVADMKKSEVELKAQVGRLSNVLKNLGRKLVMRLPISLESLEKGLSYDLIFPQEVHAWKKAASQGCVLDIRPAHEYARGAIAQSVNIPFDQLASRLEEFSKDQPILIVCESGIKSVSACEVLNSKGYHFTYVLKGGMSLYRNEDSQSRADSPSMPREAVASL